MRPAYPQKKKIGRGIENQTPTVKTEVPDPAKIPHRPRILQALGNDASQIQTDLKGRKIAPVVALETRETKKTADREIKTVSPRPMAIAPPAAIRETGTMAEAAAEEISEAIGIGGITATATGAIPNTVAMGNPTNAEATMEAIREADVKNGPDGMVGDAGDRPQNVNLKT